jgi:hypothetical protein
MGEVRPDAGIPFGGPLSLSAYDRLQKAMLPLWMRKWVVVPFILYCFVVNGRSLDDLVNMPVVTMLCLALAMAVLLLTWGGVRFYRRRGWKQAVGLIGQIVGSADEEGVCWNTAHSKSRFPWAKFTKLRKRPDILLLYVTPRAVLYFPHEFFGSDEDFAAFAALATQKLARPH